MDGGSSPESCGRSTDDNRAVRWACLDGSPPPRTWCCPVLSYPVLSVARISPVRTAAQSPRRQLLKYELSLRAQQLRNSLALPASFDLAASAGRHRGSKLERADGRSDLNAPRWDSPAKTCAPPDEMPIERRAASWPMMAQPRADTSRLERVSLCIRGTPQSHSAR